jgi:hypothetical protein
MKLKGMVNLPGEFACPQIKQLRIKFDLEDKD